jgi:hypothetical protein
MNILLTPILAMSEPRLKEVANSLIQVHMMYLDPWICSHIFLHTKQISPVPSAWTWSEVGDMVLVILFV